MRQAVQRQEYLDRAVDRAERQSQSQRAIVSGYDADSGRVRLRIAGSKSGEEVLAQSISNGAIERGAQVTMQSARGTQRLTVDGMPR